jgi:hypothetical protein
VISASRRNDGRNRLILFGILALALLGGTIFLVQVADGVKPDRQEIRVELPNALGN